MSRTHAPEPDAEAPPERRRKRAIVPAIVLSVLLAASVFLGFALWPRSQADPVLAAGERPAPVPITPAPIVPTSTTTVASVVAPPPETLATEPPPSAAPPEPAPRPARRPVRPQPTAEVRAHRPAPAVPSSARYRIDDLKPLPSRK